MLRHHKLGQHEKRAISKQSYLEDGRRIIQEDLIEKDLVIAFINHEDSSTTITASNAGDPTENN